MQFKFKKHQIVRILRAPNPEYTEYHMDETEDNSKKESIKAGMKGKINIILSNGKYHVEILDSKDNVIAFAPFEEEDLDEYK